MNFKANEKRNTVKKFTAAQLLTKFPNFMEPEVLLIYSAHLPPHTVLHPKPDASSTHLQIPTSISVISVLSECPRLFRNNLFSK